MSPRRTPGQGARITASYAEGYLEDPTVDDPNWDHVDRLERALEAAGPAGLTGSAAGRKVGIDTTLAHHLLCALVRDQVAHTSGTGGRCTRYHLGRAR